MKLQLKCQRVQVYIQQDSIYDHLVFDISRSSMATSATTCLHIPSTVMNWVPTLYVQ